jgi:hypothetical protein
MPLSEKLGLPLFAKLVHALMTASDTARFKE